ncbi:MAG TPA: hypothetical protein PKL85_12855 [Bacteroidia bacterium]|mgnify:CR=1 FL=1|nr:hypothetical protein [Bacteroidia bacterium]
MKKLLLLFTFFICVAFTPSDYVLLHQIPFNHVKAMTTDNLGNVFVIVENQLLEFDASGKPKANYSEKNLGELRSVDVGNPMKIELFYPDFGRIVMLNSSLAVQSTINLRALGISQASLACHSFVDGYWIFDLQDYQLKKVTLDLQIASQSGDVRKWSAGKLLPNFLIEADGFVYLNDPSQGILVFDRYGTYYKNIPLKGLSNFQIIENELLYFQEGSYKAFHLKTLSERSIILPAQDSILSARIEMHQLYLLTSGSLSFYSF